MPQSLTTIIAGSIGRLGQFLNRYHLNSPHGSDGIARDHRASGRYDPSDWAWEFLRRNPDYWADWRAAVPRHLPHLGLRDGTQLLRLRRCYPRAERWGLYAFADPQTAAPEAFMFWCPSAIRRLVRARCVSPNHRGDRGSLTLADFKVRRTAVIGIDGIPVVTLRGQGGCVAIEIHGLRALACPASMVFELDRLDDLNVRMEDLKLLQRFTQAQAIGSNRSPFANDERLHHALIALDESTAGKTYRQIAIVIFGEQRVAEEWAGASQFLKDRTRRLVAKGHELMRGGYRDLLL